MARLLLLLLLLLGVGKWQRYKTGPHPLIAILVMHSPHAAAATRECIATTNHATGIATHRIRLHPPTHVPVG